MQDEVSVLAHCIRNVSVSVEMVIGDNKESLGPGVIILRRFLTEPGSRVLQ